MGRRSHNETSDSLEERVRQTLKGLHWSGRFCQVREIQQMQARGGSWLMAEAADGRDGRSARKGGSTIDVTRGWTNDGAFGWSWLGAMDQRSGGHSHLSRERARAAVLQGGGFPSPAPRHILRMCLGVFICVSVCAHVCL